MRSSKPFTRTRSAFQPDALSAHPILPIEACESAYYLRIQGKDHPGVLAQVAVELANAEADITHVDMDDEVAMDTIDLRFVVAVRDQAHLETALRNLRRAPSVLRASRILPSE